MIDFGQLAMLSVFPLGCLAVGFLAFYIGEHEARRDREAELEMRHSAAE